MMQEESQDKKIQHGRVQNSKLLLSPISSNCQLAGEKNRDLHGHTTEDKVEGIR